MATTAIHSAGDISRNPPDICQIFSKDTKNYIGNWVTGFGFVDVKFPKSTTRKLTKKDIKKYHGMMLGMSDMVCFLNLTGEKVGKHVTLEKNGAAVFSGKLESPLKVGSILYVVNSEGRYYHTSTIKSIKKNVVKTQNSTYKIIYQ